MQRDAFYEESAISTRAEKEAKIYTVFHVVSIIFFVLAAIHLSFSFNAIGLWTSGDEPLTGLALAVNCIIWFGLAASLVGIGLSFFFLKRRFNVSYDYTFVEDELRITKVFNGKRRKHLITLEADRILSIGWVENDSYDRATGGLTKKQIKILTSNREPAEGKTFLYIVYSSPVTGKSVYVLEAREMLLEYLVPAAGRTKLERK